MTMPDSRREDDQRNDPQRKAAQIRDAQKEIDSYLAHLRGLLRGLDRNDIQEILEELRSHILDKTATGGETTVAGIDAALAALGSPEQLAGEYVTENLLARAEISRSPWRVLHILFRWATLSVAGFFVLLTSLFWYFVGICFWLCAASKPFHPHTAGLWLIPSGAGANEISLRLGFTNAPMSGHEVLGWWIMPLGLIGGGGLIILTTRLALWCARQYSRSKNLRRS
jgi:hypothetical protein